MESSLFCSTWDPAGPAQKPRAKVCTPDDAADLRCPEGPSMETVTSDCLSRAEWASRGDHHLAGASWGDGVQWWLRGSEGSGGDWWARGLRLHEAGWLTPLKAEAGPGGREEAQTARREALPPPTDPPVRPTQPTRPQKGS